MRNARRGRALRELADEELMPLVVAKDARAFEVFYDRHAAAAYSLAYRIVGDAKIAEDVTQEAFLSIWRSRAGYDAARGSVRSWTLVVLRNRALDALRRSAGRAPKLDLDDDELLEGQAAPERTDIEASRREDARHVHGALAQLPREQSQVLELAYFGGFSQSEIAEMAGLPLGTVKSRMRIGLEKLRVSLAEGVLDGMEGKA